MSALRKGRRRGKAPSRASKQRRLGTGQEQVLNWAFAVWPKLRWFRLPPALIDKCRQMKVEVDRAYKDTSVITRGVVW